MLLLLILNTADWVEQEKHNFHDSEQYNLLNRIIF